MAPNTPALARQQWLLRAVQQRQRSHPPTHTHTDCVGRGGAQPCTEQTTENGMYRRIQTTKPLRLTLSDMHVYANQNAEHGENTAQHTATLRTVMAPQGKYVFKSEQARTSARAPLLSKWRAPRPRSGKMHLSSMPLHCSCAASLRLAAGQCIRGSCPQADMHTHKHV